VSALAANDLIRRLAIFGALNLLILSLILVSVSGNGNDIFLGFILGFGFLLLFFGTIVIIGFFQTKDGYDVRLANLEQFLSVIFLTVGLITNNSWIFCYGNISHHPGLIASITW
tara:strand:+ start:24 stop:365 length:342 start_codon:yes stop_codon:yes gene_type:complete